MAFLTTETTLQRRYNTIRVISATVAANMSGRHQEVQVQEAINNALGKLSAQADQLTADGVIAISITTSFTNPLLVTLLGTAIKF